MNQTNAKRDAQALETLAKYALDTLEALRDEVKTEDDPDFCYDAKVHATAAIVWLEEGLSRLPSRQGVPYRKGRGAPAELDALVRYGLGALHVVKGSLANESHTRFARRLMAKASVELTDRVAAIKQNGKRYERRPKTEVVDAAKPASTPTGEAADFAS